MITGYEIKILILFDIILYFIFMGNVCYRDFDEEDKMLDESSEMEGST
jgi:hypothetical protein